jgi:CRP-like cAMP-binding protein
MDFSLISVTVINFKSLKNVRTGYLIFKQFINITQKEILLIKELSTIKDFSKNEFILIQGNVCDFVAFVNKGAFRIFYSVDGQEFSKEFIFENNFCTDYTSFLTGKKTVTYIQAIEESTVIFFKKGSC